jgi:BON domain-containing protein
MHFARRMPNNGRPHHTHDRDYRGPEREYRRGFDERYDERTSGRGWSQSGDQFAERDREAASYSRQADRDYERNTTGYGFEDGSIDEDPEYRAAYGAPYGQSGSQAGFGRPVRWRRGPHAGKGPANYQRSDERIRELINEALTEHDEIDATNIEVHVRTGEVILTGTVDDRRMKRLAEDTCERVTGVKDVQNQLKVSYDRRQRPTP